MTHFNKRVYDMLMRVVVFRNAYQELIGGNALAGQLFQQLDAAFQKLAKHATSQHAGKDAVRLSSEVRAAARNSVVSQLETICRTAAGIGLKQFWMPRERADQAFVRAAETFLERLTPLKSQFLEHHLPEDFIDKLAAATGALKKALQHEAESKGRRTEATRAIKEAQTEAFQALSRLDPLMVNLLADNPPVQAVWESARHVERVGRPVKTEEQDPEASTPIPAPPEPTPVAVQTQA